MQAKFLFSCSKIKTYLLRLVDMLNSWYWAFLLMSLLNASPISCKHKTLWLQWSFVNQLQHYYMYSFVGFWCLSLALENAIAYCVNAFSLVLYVIISPSCKNTWSGFSREAFYEIYKFLKLSIPSTIMLTYYYLLTNSIFFFFFSFSISFIFWS